MGSIQCDYEHLEITSIETSLFLLSILFGICSVSILYTITIAPLLFYKNISNNPSRYVILK